MRAKRASPPQELEFTGPEGPEILVNQNPTLPTKLSLRVIQNTLDNFQEIWEVGNKKQNVLNPLVNCLSTSRTITIINPSLSS